MGGVCRKLLDLMKDRSSREIISLKVSINLDIFVLDSRGFDPLVEILRGNDPGRLGDAINGLEGFIGQNSPPRLAMARTDGTVMTRMIKSVLSAASTPSREVAT